MAGISTGTVYPVLNRLERDGLLDSRLVASTSGPARKYYGVTPPGEEALADAISGWENLAAAVRSVLGSDTTTQAGETDEESAASASMITEGKTA